MAKPSFSRAASAPRLPRQLRSVYGQAAARMANGPLRKSLGAAGELTGLGFAAHVCRRVGTRCILPRTGWVALGLSDIYFSATSSATGNGAKLENLGPVVNTRENDLSPFYHPLYHVLYFSSRGQLLNFGDFDIYKTYKRGRALAGAQKHWAASEWQGLGVLFQHRRARVKTSITPVPTSQRPDQS